MSRSYRKTPIIRDGTKADRAIHHRRFRSKNRQRIKEGKEPLLSKEVTNPYDIVDWVYSMFREDVRLMKAESRWYTEEQIDEIYRKFMSK